MSIADHYCGQTQPHAAHEWKPPAPYGQVSIGRPRQCAGLAVAPNSGTTPLQEPEPAPDPAVVAAHQEHPIYFDNDGPYCAGCGKRYVGLSPWGDELDVALDAHIQDVLADRGSKR